MFTICHVSEPDIDKIAKLEREVFSDAWSRRALLNSYLRKNTIFLGVYDGSMLIGYLIVYYVLDEGEIARIAVDKEYRRQGAAGHMLLKLEEFCEKQGITKLMLEVRESNEAAIAFYKDYGFTEDGVRRDYYAAPREDAVLMSRVHGR